jgi:hypothetical protein
MRVIATDCLEALRTDESDRLAIPLQPDRRLGGLAIGDYLMDYYNRQGPHTFNDGMPPVVAEEKLKILSGIS